MLQSRSSYRIGIIFSIMGTLITLFNFFYFPMQEHTLFGSPSHQGPPIQVFQMALDNFHFETGWFLDAGLFLLPYFSACIIFILSSFALFIDLSRFLCIAYLFTLIIGSLATIQYLLYFIVGDVGGLVAMVIGFMGMTRGYRVIIIRRQEVIS